MRHVFQSAVLAMLLIAVSEQAYCQFDFPATTIRLENDTYAGAIQSLRNGDREAAMNLINRDPLVARFAWIRLLRDHSASDLAANFAQLFPLNSRSELEMPFMRLYEKLPAEQRGQWLDWLDTASRAQFVIAHETNDKFWFQARAQAVQDLEAAGRFFKAGAFPTGEAFCLRILADESFFVWDLPSFDRAQRLYQEALSIYSAAQNARGEVLALAGLGTIRRRMQEMPQTREYRNDALKKIQSADDRIAEIYLLLDFPNMSTAAEKKAAWTTLEHLPGVASLKYSVLLVLAGDEHDAESKKYFDTIERMLAAETDRVTAAHFYLSLYSAIKYDANWNYELTKGLPYLDRAIEIARDLPYDMSAYNPGSTPQPAVPAMLFTRGYSEMELIDYSRAELTFLAALEASKQSGDTSGLGYRLGRESLLDGGLAGVYQITGDYPRAIEWAQEGLQIAEQIEDGDVIVSHLGLLAQVHAELGDLRLAEEELAKAAQVHTPIVSHPLNDLAEIHLNLGFYSQALKDLEDLDKLFKQRTPGGGVSSIYMTVRLKLLALTWLRLGDMTKAMDFAKATDARPPGHNVEEGVVGMVLIEMKRYPEAEKYFFDRLSHPDWGKGTQSDAHKNLGRIYRLQNRRSEAIAHLTKALEIYRAMFRRRDELELLLELGQVALRGSPNEARPYFQQAVKLAEETQWPQGMWSARAGLADLAKAEKNTGMAIEELKSALNAVETVSARLNSEITRSSFIDDKVALYDDLIRLMGSSLPGEAFEYAERRRAQSFLDGALRQDVKLASDSELLRKKNEAEARLVGKQKMLMEQYSRAPADRNVALMDATRHDLEGIQLEHTELLRRLEDEDPVEASRHGLVRAVTVADVQRDILKPGDALVEYLVTSREIFAFLITPERCRFIALAATHDMVANRIQRLLAPFAQLQSGRVDLLHVSYDVPLAHQLYKDLIAPLEPYIPRVRRLIIVPDDVLNYLPFESLARSPALGQPQPNMTYAEYRDVDWLVNHYSVVYAVSATSLHPRFHQVNPEPESLLAFGNPKLSVSQLKEAAVTLRGAGMDATMPALGSLPQSGREASVVAQLLRPKVRATVLIGEQARKTEFLRQGPAAGYIHFAVHSILDEQQPYYSALVLSPDAESGGLLQTYEIMKTRLSARLVTLSSCETALGKLYKGEGLLGLRRAFLMAGAESVVVSFWSIDDSTAGFMEIFYGNIGRGQPVAEALRNSKLQYLKKTMPAGSQQISLSHPFFWAPFALSSTSIR